MKQLKFFTAIIVAILFSNCTNQQHLSQEQKAQMIKEVKVLLNHYPEAVKQKDLGWFKSFWANHENFIYAADGHVITDYDGFIKSYYQDGLAGVKELYRFDWSNAQAAVLNENTVSYAAAFDWGMINTAGDTIQAKGSGLYIFEKLDGNWKVVNCGAAHVYY